VGPPIDDEGSCVDGAEARDVGLAFAGPDAAYLVAGDGTWTSTDRGVTWGQS
jgi:hypothetical protein